MGFTLAIFCYLCKEYIYIHKPDLDDDVESLYEGGHNVKLEESIKIEMWGEKMNGVATASPELVRTVVQKYAEEGGSELEFVEKHTPHDQFCSCDSYGSYPWEPPMEELELDYSEWYEWKGSIYHPRTLVEDLNILDWPTAKLAIENGAYLRDENRLIQIRKRFFEFVKYYKLEKKLNLNPLPYSKLSNPPPLKELCAKFLVETYFQKLEEPDDDFEPATADKQMFFPLPVDIIQYLRNYCTAKTKYIVHEFGTALSSPYLPKIDISWEGCYGDDVDYVVSVMNDCAAHLEKFSMEGTIVESIPGPDIGQIVAKALSLPVLKSLNVGYTSIDFSSELNLAGNLPLQVLSVSNTEVNVENLSKVLKICPQLEKLYADECSNLNANILEHVGKNLKVLSMQDTPLGEVSKSLEEHVLQNVTTLRVLKIAGSVEESHRNFIASWVAKLSDLQSFSCGQANNKSFAMNDWIASSLSNARQLRELRLVNSDIKNETVEALVNSCRELKKVYLLLCPNITTAIFASLGKLPKLEFLDVSGFPSTNWDDDQITSVTLAKTIVENCKSLTKLYLLGVEAYNDRKEIKELMRSNLKIFTDSISQ